MSTRSGERLTGAVQAKCTARTTWSAAPLALDFGQSNHVDFRSFPWAYRHADGRRLVDRLRLADDELRTAAELLDSPEWAKGAEMLEEIRKGYRRQTDEYQAQVKLMLAVSTLRSGDFAAAGKALRALERDPHVGPLAGGYEEVLARFPDHAYMGASLSEPDVMWRASHEVAEQLLAEVDQQIEQWDDLNPNAYNRTLRQLEWSLDVADRLAIGIAQSKIIEALVLALEVKRGQFDELIGEYNGLITEWNRGARRHAQARIRRELGKVENRMEVIVKEAQRIFDRLATDGTGFVLDPPELPEMQP